MGEKITRFAHRKSQKYLSNGTCSLQSRGTTHTQGHEPHSTERGFWSQWPRLWATEAGQQRAPLGMSVPGLILISDEENIVGQVSQGLAISIWFWWCRDVA